MRCPAGHVTSIWDMGGIRFGAAGHPIRRGKCATCGKSFMAKVERTDG